MRPRRPAGNQHESELPHRSDSKRPLTPERFGGTRNWDYRYCWRRDATFTLLALMSAGYTREAAAWRDWLVRAVADFVEDSGTRSLRTCRGPE